MARAPGRPWRKRRSLPLLSRTARKERPLRLVRSGVSRRHQGQHCRWGLPGGSQGDEGPPDRANPAALLDEDRGGRRGGRRPFAGNGARDPRRSYGGHHPLRPRWKRRLAGKRLRCLLRFLGGFPRTPFSRTSGNTPSTHSGEQDSSKSLAQELGAILSTTTPTTIRAIPTMCTGPRTSFQISIPNKTEPTVPSPDHMA